MRVAVAADHARHALKERLGDRLASRGHDLGTDDASPSEESTTQKQPADRSSGARVIGDSSPLEMADASLAVRFDGGERHCRSSDEIRVLEARFNPEGHHG